MLLGEKYNIHKNYWTTLSSYNELLEDNLDSWACSYTFDIPGYRESKQLNDEENQMNYIYE